MHVFVSLYIMIYLTDSIHFISNRSVVMFVCKLNVSGFCCHTLPVIFSCTKQLIMLLDAAKPDTTFNEVS